MSEQKQKQYLNAAKLTPRLISALTTLSSVDSYLTSENNTCSLFNSHTKKSVSVIFTEALNVLNKNVVHGSMSNTGLVLLTL